MNNHTCPHCNTEYSIFHSKDGTSGYWCAPCSSLPTFRTKIDTNAPASIHSAKDANKLLDAVARIALALQKVDPALHADFQFVLQDRKDSYDRGYAQGVADGYNSSKALAGMQQALSTIGNLSLNLTSVQCADIANKALSPTQALQYSDSPLKI